MKKKFNAVLKTFAGKHHKSREKAEELKQGPGPVLIGEIPKAERRVVDIIIHATGEMHKKGEFIPF